MTELTQSQKRYVHYKEIAHLSKDFEWSFSAGYATQSYKAIAKTDEARALSAHDVALLADGGNLCFGGRNFSKSGDTYSGVIYTD